ncbi:hypothetical protein [Tellurirhabdus bombi]|uniref:hypothetical protein n=1 Tax=Tellurirhabdus bombi TaxID=2907205 RepID=UPI001F3BBD2F|nr:hypothetical protein [Tellurirhabdus bombi]
MTNKPVKAKLHGILDYAFAGVQLTLPAILGINPTAVKTYRAIGLGFLTANALTDTPAGIYPVISLPTHKKVDAASILSQSLLTFAPFIRKDQTALNFHLGFLGAAITNYLLTDYQSQPRK